MVQYPYAEAATSVVQITGNTTRERTSIMETKEKVIRWVIVHGPKDNPIWSAPARQGRYTYESEQACRDNIEEMVKSTPESTLQQVHGVGTIGTYRPAAWYCYPNHFDPIQSVDICTTKDTGGAA